MTTTGNELATIATDLEALVTEQPAPYIWWDDAGSDASVQDVLDTWACDRRGAWWDNVGEKTDPSCEEPPSADEIDLIVAWYEYEDYSGSAFVIYRSKADGLLYEVSGSHCSCFGLEGQWEYGEPAAAVELLAREHFVSTYGWSDAQKAEQRRHNDVIRATLQAWLT